MNYPNISIPYLAQNISLGSNSSDNPYPFGPRDPSRRKTLSHGNWYSFSGTESGPRLKVEVNNPLILRDGSPFTVKVDNQDVKFYNSSLIVKTQNETEEINIAVGRLKNGELIFVGLWELEKKQKDKNYNPSIFTVNRSTIKEDQGGVEFALKEINPKGGKSFATPVIRISMSGSFRTPISRKIRNKWDG